MDLGDEILARARDAAARTNPVSPSDAELESLRVEAMEQLALIPDPPMYRRATDPARDQAKARLQAAEALLERALLFVKAAQNSQHEPKGRAIANALESQVLALAAIAQGQVTRGEQLVEKARIGARAVSELAAAFHRVQSEQQPIYRRADGISRYDPHEPEHLEVNLVCANLACRKPGLYALSVRSPTHRFTCKSCRQNFVGYFGEVRSVEAQRRPASMHYGLQMLQVGGGERRVEFDDASGGVLPVAPRDLVALLYNTGQTLTAVENLSNARVLWVKSKDGCFIATAAYGPNAIELDDFRAFRDRVLRRSTPGRAFIAAYYALGPIAARAISKSPRARARVRAGLDWLRRSLTK